MPIGVFLAARDPSAGMYFWIRAQADVEGHSTRQARGYSRALAAFPLAAPPDWLGAPMFLPKELFDDWGKVDELATNAKRAAIISALNKVLVAQ